MPSGFSCMDHTVTYGREASGENAHRHRRNIGNSDSCKVPKGETITLEEWKIQQREKPGPR